MTYHTPRNDLGNLTVYDSSTKRYRGCWDAARFRKVVGTVVKGRR